jgi:glycosyltransferase involved in cell wall biosynthesis
MMELAAPVCEQVLLPAAPLYGEPLESMLDPVGALRLSILMPVRNAEATIVRAVSDVLNVGYPCPMELIVVDDGSTDCTVDRLAEIHDDRLTVFRHQGSRGKGTALLTAASLAAGTHLMVFDADPDYSAEDIPRILRPVLAGRCQVVYGTRLSGYHAVYPSRRYARGNRLLTLAANVLFDACLSDLHTGLRLVPRATFDELALREPGSGLGTEMTALLLKQGVRPFEVAVSYHGDSPTSRHEITWRDVLDCIRILLRVRFGRRTPAPAEHLRGRRFDDPRDWAETVKAIDTAGLAGPPELNQVTQITRLPTFALLPPLPSETINR